MHNIGVGRHFWVADHHSHPTRVEVGRSVAFCKIVACGVGWKEGTWKPHGGQVGFVHVTFHARYAVFEQVSDERLTVTCPPVEGTTTGGNGRVGDGTVDPIHLWTDGSQHHGVNVE